MYAERLFDYKSISNRPNLLKRKFRDLRTKNRLQRQQVIKKNSASSGIVSFVILSALKLVEKHASKTGFVVVFGFIGCFHAVVMRHV